MADLTLDRELALSLWRAGLTQELGIKIAVDRDDITRIQKLMYDVRKEAADPSLDCLSLVVAPGAQQVWIVKKPTELP